MSIDKSRDSGKKILPKRSFLMNCEHACSFNGFDESLVFNNDFTHQFSISTQQNSDPRSRRNKRQQKFVPGKVV